MNDKRKVLKKASLADLIFRAIFIIFSILTVGITIHTYQLSVNTINEEVKRNLEQTSALLENYFNHRLAILQIRQDTDAGSLGLKDHYGNDRILNLEQYFADIEAKEPSNSPDFRFLEANNHVFWSDDNHLFLGMNSENLKYIIDKNIYINTWYYLTVTTDKKITHLLIRRTPVVSSFTGEVRSYLYNAAILNNNISFVHSLKRVSRSQEIFIVNNKKLISSTIKKSTARYAEVEECIGNGVETFAGKILNYTPLKIKSLNGSLSIVSLKNKENVTLLEQRFIYSVVLSFFVLIAIAVLVRGLFEHRILLALNALLSYAKSVSKKNGNKHYLGSGILEFDQIGAKLEDIFIELIEAKEESHKAQAAAEKLTQVKSDFLARMSHEIRTPLNGILGISSLLKQAQLPLEQKKQIQIIHQGGEHLLAVLNDILDFSQIEQDKLNINFEEFVLDDVLDTISAIYTPLCMGKNITFNLNNKIDTDVILYTDKVRLTQILFNLLSNGVKFTELGLVTLSLNLESKNGQIFLCFDVEDTGVGIGIENQASVFDPFIQVESTGTRKFGGSGLGLAIVKQLLHLLNGSITVVSSPGLGTLFTIRLPVEVIEYKKELPSEASSHHEYLLPINLKVLLVEDNKSNAYIAKAYCQKYSLDVTWVTSAAEGIQMIKEHSFDLVLMDNQMPEMSGIEATRYIRKTLNLSLPIYAYTADVLEDATNEFLSAGADYIITKPIKEKSILDALVFYKAELKRKN
ncbi:LuxQ periplasmic sensor domain-containing protein [Aliivibrio salmonicida]|uniref:LuxQ periplasmic sensor domain-containing protein n=1 Tax=Aliivibrio salmonicida TaxID=40269 RepID=UPI003D107CE3